MAKSDKNIVRDILRAQGVYVHGDVPEPTDEAVKILRDYGFSRWQEGNTDAIHDYQDSGGSW